MAILLNESKRPQPEVVVMPGDTRNRILVLRQEELTIRYSQRS